VLRDQLLLPYFAGRDFALHLHKRGGWDALKQAWTRPPQSTEQVLHPEKYDSREAPRTVDLSYAPGRGRAINEGVLGEVLIRTFLGEGATQQEAAAGWGGDQFRAWDLSGKTLLVWRSVWDSPKDAREFLAAAQARLGALHAHGTRRGYRIYASPSRWVAVGERASGIDLISSDDQPAFEAALTSLAGS
jgi:hypothetical protein